MPQLSSPLSTPAGMPLLNAAHLGKAAGLAGDTTVDLWLDPQPIPGSGISAEITGHGIAIVPEPDAAFVMVT